MPGIERHSDLSQLAKVLAETGTMSVSAIFKKVNDIKLKRKLDVMITKKEIRRVYHAHAPKTCADFHSFDAKAALQRLEDTEGLQSAMHLNELSQLTRVFFTLPCGKQYWEWAQCVNRTFLFVDTTHGCTYGNAKVGFLVSSTPTGRSIPLAVFLIYDETAATFQWVFETFHQFLGCATVVMSDEADAISLGLSQSPLKSATHLLCIWHKWCNFFKHVRHAVRSQDEWDALRSSWWGFSMKTDSSLRSSFKERWRNAIIDPLEAIFQRKFHAEKSGLKIADGRLSVSIKWPRNLPPVGEIMDVPISLSDGSKGRVSIRVENRSQSGETVSKSFAWGHVHTPAKASWRRLRSYLNTQCSQREKWVGAFTARHLTCGAKTTQRSESIHNSLKSHIGWKRKTFAEMIEYVVDMAKRGATLDVKRTEALQGAMSYCAKYQDAGSTTVPLVTKYLRGRGKSLSDAGRKLLKAQSLQISRYKHSVTETSGREVWIVETQTVHNKAEVPETRGTVSSVSNGELETISHTAIVKENVPRCSCQFRSMWSCICRHELYVCNELAKIEKMTELPPELTSGLVVWVAIDTKEKSQRQANRSASLTMAQRVQLTPQQRLRHMKRTFDLVAVEAKDNKKLYGAVMSWITRRIGLNGLVLNYTSDPPAMTSKPRRTKKNIPKRRKQRRELGMKRKKKKKKRRREGE